MCLTYFFILVILQITQNLASTRSSRRVIIDVDGGIGDIEALVILLNADAQQDIKIEAITCTSGIIDLLSAKKNVMRLLGQAGRTDIPVYAGSFSPILPINGSLELPFGTDGFDNMIYKREVSTDRVKKVLSPTFIAQLVQKHPGQVTLICLGPLTNVALALRLYDSVAGNLKDVIIMGGNYGEDTPELNFQTDPEAAEIVLATAGVPIIMLPFQGCTSAIYTYDWYFSFPNMSNPVWDLVDGAERTQFGLVYPESAWIRCEPILAAAFVNPEIVTSLTSASVRVDLIDQRGLVVQNTDLSPFNVKIIETYDDDEYPVIYLDAFDNICQQDDQYCVYEY